MGFWGSLFGRSPYVKGMDRNMSLDFVNAHIGGFKTARDKKVFLAAMSLSFSGYRWAKLLSDGKKVEDGHMNFLVDVLNTYLLLRLIGAKFALKDNDINEFEVLRLSALLCDLDYACGRLNMFSSSQQLSGSIATHLYMAYKEASEKSLLELNAIAAKDVYIALKNLPYGQEFNSGSFDLDFSLDHSMISTLLASSDVPISCDESMCNALQSAV